MIIFLDILKFWPILKSHSIDQTSPIPACLFVYFIFGIFTLQAYEYTEIDNLDLFIADCRQTAKILKSFFLAMFVQSSLCIFGYVWVYPRRGHNKTIMLPIKFKIHFIFSCLKNTFLTVENKEYCLSLLCLTTANTNYYKANA